VQVSDTLFTWVDLQAKQNNELLKNLGNFVHRTLSFLAKPAGLKLLTSSQVLWEHLIRQGFADLHLKEL